MMKKIFALVLFLVLGKLSFSQGYPLQQNLGSDSTLVISKGALQSRLINVTFTDTTQANTQRIKAYPGAQIATTTGGINLWVRNATATAWVPVAVGSGNNIYTIDGTLTGNRTLSGGGNSLTFTGLSQFLLTVGNQTFTVKSDSATLTKRLSYTGNLGSTFKMYSLVDKNYVDSSIASSPAGTVTQINTNNNTGITGGPITSTGTLAIDTLLISTRAWRQKGVDSLQANINLKLNIVDTTGMLAHYFNSVGYGLGKSSQTVYVDSASLSNYYLRRKDSLTATNPLGYVTKKVLADTAAAIRGADAGGTVTSVATNNGTGITGGTITTSGTLSIDTTLISTRAWRQKGVDSLQANINLKLNISDTAAMLSPYLRSNTAAATYVPQTRTLTINGTTQDLSANRTYNVGTVTSVGLTMPAAFAVAGSPVTSSGTLAVTGAGLASQYIRGDGTLANFPGGGGGGGSSVSYYLNGSVNQGTFVGNTYYQMSKTANTGASANFTIGANGYIAQFITDAGDPSLLSIPAGNWNFELYFSASSAGGNPQFYVELYKYNGTAFTLISSGSTSPESITGGTVKDLYISSLSVPATSLTITDRLAVRIYIIHDGRTITLYTQNGNLCQIITTFTTGITALNSLTAQVQYLTTGTSGTDFNISSLTDTHTFNLPVASATNTGKLSSTDWSTFNNKVGGSGTTNYLPKFTGTSTIGNSGLQTDANGNLGIGTSLSNWNVGYKAIQSNSTLIISSTIESDLGNNFYIDGTNNAYYLQNGGATIYQQYGSNHRWVTAPSGTAGNVATFTERMLLTPTGLGIGTSPDSLLTVNLGTNLKRGVRMSGLPQAPGTKALRIDAAGTISYADTLIDAGGTVTSVATNNGTGITGGTITTTGTLAIDTLLISTRAWRQKGIDSVIAVSANKYVPYTGAITSLDMGIYNIDAQNISSRNFVTGAFMSGISRSDATASAYGVVVVKRGAAGYIRPNPLSIDRDWYLPDADGTIALTSDLSSYVPTSRTLTINGTSYDLSANRSWSVGTVTSVATNNGTGITGGTITTTGTLAIDTLLVSTRAWRQKGIDSVQANLTAGLATKLNISDTAAMLSPYARTNVVNAALATKLNISDTASMLNPYLRKVDTTAMLSPYKTFYPRTAISLTTTGSSGAATYNNSTGVLNIPVYTDAFTGTVTSVATNTGTGITGGTITTTGTLAIDTLLISTRAWRQKGVDSLQANINQKLNISDTASMLSPYLRSNVAAATYVPQTRTITINGTSQDLSANRTYNVGTVTSVATNTGTGITGGTITTSGTIAADTLLLSTRAWRQKGVDSVASLINTRISGTTNYIPKFTSSSAIGNSQIFDNGTSVGINTITPSASYKLDVNGYARASSFYVPSGASGGGFIFDAGGNAGIGIAQSGNILQYYTGGSERMRLDASGNLGINTSSPTAKLDVVGGNGDGIQYRTSTRAIGIGQISNEASIFWGSGTPLTFNSGTLRMTLDASGNLGLGVTPTTWSNGFVTMAFANNANNIGANAGSYFEFNQNAYFDGGWKYVGSQAATRYEMGVGNHYWFNAPSGTAGTSLTWTQAMTLFSTGNLAVGGTSDNGYRLNITGNGYFSSSIDANSYIRNTNTGADNSVTISNDGSNAYIQANNAARTGYKNLLLNPYGSNVGIGTTSPNNKLDVNGNLGVTTGNGAFFYRSANDYYWRINNDANNFLNFGTYAANGTAYGTNPKMILLDNGNVGIGTTSPNNKLDVNGNLGVTTGNGAFFYRSANDYYWRINNDANNFLNFGTYAANGTAYGTNPKMILLDNGNVGIGTTSPSYTLQVAGIGKFEVQSGATNNTAPTALIVANKTTGAHTSSLGSSLQFEFTNSGGAYSGGLISSVGGADPFTADLRFSARNYGYVEAMRITSGGNVGIGTSSPTGLLHLYGANPAFRIQNSGTGNMQFGQWDGTYNRIQSSGRDFLLISTDATNLLFSTNDAERMRITSGGDVGIGTTSPGSRLTVSNSTAGNLTSYIINGVTAASGSTGYGLAIESEASAATSYALTVRNLAGSNTYFHVSTATGMVGNVGIGTTSPNNLLTLYNASSAIYSQWVQSGTGTGSTDGLRIGLDASSNGIINLNEGTSLITSVDGSERMRITSGGELLINTTSDAGDYKLQVNGSTFLANTNATVLRINGTSGYAGLLTQSGHIEFYKDAGITKAAAIGFATPAIAATNDMQFSMYDGSTWSNRMTLTNAGNLEIISGSIKTAAPSGGTAGAWKLGTYGTAIGGSTGYAIPVEIDGTLYYLMTGYLPEPAPEAAPNAGPAQVVSTRFEEPVMKIKTDSQRVKDLEKEVAELKEMIKGLIKK